MGAAASQEAFNILPYGLSRLRATQGEHGPRQLYMDVRVVESALHWVGGGLRAQPLTRICWERERNVSHLQAGPPGFAPLGLCVPLGMKKKSFE